MIEVTAVEAAPATTHAGPDGQGVVLGHRIAKDSRVGPEGALAAISALHALGLRCSLELLSAGGGGEVRIWTETPYAAEVVRQQLGGAYPRSALQQLPAQLSLSRFTLTTSFALARADPIPLPLVGPSPTARLKTSSDCVAGLLAALDQARPAELLLLQLVLRPGSGHRWSSWAGRALHDLEQAAGARRPRRIPWDVFRREPDPVQAEGIERMAEGVKFKLGGPLFFATVRLVASSRSRGRTIDLLRNALAPIAAIEHAGLNYLVPLRGRAFDEEVQLVEPRLPSHELLLSPNECLTLWHPPAAAAAGLGTLKRGVDLPLPDTADTGIQIGWSSAGPDAEPIRLPERDLRKHVVCVGATGGGKSTTVLQILLSALEGGYGLGLIDVKGDLADHLLGRIPQHRRRDIVVIDPSDPDCSVGIDLFGIARRIDLDLAADFVVSAFQALFADSWGVNFPRLMKATVRALLEVPGMTVLDVPRFLRDPAFRARILDQVHDEAVRDYFALEFDQQGRGRQAQSISPVLSRVGVALESAFGRRLFGQTSETDLRTIMDTSRALVCRYHSGLMGKRNASFFAGLTAAACQLAAMTRVELPESARKLWMLVCDEAHNYATTTFTETLSEGRGYGFCAVLVTQFLRQMPPEVVSSILANTNSLISFRLGEEDAALLANRFAPYVQRFELAELDDFVALGRVSINGQRVPPFTIHVRPPAVEMNGEVAEEVRRLSREQYGRARNVVVPLRRRAGAAAPAPTSLYREDVDED